MGALFQYWHIPACMARAVPVRVMLVRKLFTGRKNGSKGGEKLFKKLRAED